MVEVRLAGVQNADVGRHMADEELRHAGLGIPHHEHVALQETRDAARLYAAMIFEACMR